MDLHVTFEGRGDLAGQIYRQIRSAVLDGRLRPGNALPPTRELARSLSVSRNTVGAAYDRLGDEGFLDSRAGSGTYVRDIAPGPLDEPSGPPRRALRPRPPWDAIPGPPAAIPEPAFDFRAGIPDVSLFPFETWRRLLSRELRVSATPTAAYGEPAGHAALRAAISRHIGVSRAVRAGADDVIVTNGTQQAVDLTARVLLQPGDVVAVEEPGYPPPRLLLQSMGARVVPVPVDGEGIVVAAIPDDARLVHVSPSHQFPLGMPMSLSRRTALLAWAERHDAAVVEDDYDSEFRFGGRPLEPLQSLDRHGRVIYVGTFSKTMLPALRLGFLVAPPTLRAALRAAKYVTDWHSPLTTQAALAHFLDDGLLARHIRKMRAEYRSRYLQIIEVLERSDGWLVPLPSAAGMHLSAVLPGSSPSDARDLARRALAAGVAVQPLSHFHAASPARPGLVLGFGAIALGDIEEGLRLLRHVAGSA